MSIIATLGLLVILAPVVILGLAVTLYLFVEDHIEGSIGQ